MNKHVLFILLMSVLAFGALAFMAMATPPTPSLSASSTNSGSPPANSPPSAPAVSSVQVVSVHASGSGYDHPTLQVKAGQPVEFHFSADASAGCGAQLIIEAFNVNLVSRNGEDTVARFTPTSPGSYAFHCGMNMFRGNLNVI